MQGTLRDFGLAEILQVVAMQQKTGLLRVQSRDKLLTFYVEDGLLVSCRDRRGVANDPLLDYLKETGFLDAWQVLHLKIEIEEDRADLAELVLQKNIVSAEELPMVLEDMVQDLIHRTYDWSDGTYRFITGDEALRGLTHRVSMKMEALLLEAARRVDEWPVLRLRLPGPGVLLSKATELPDWLDDRSRELLSQLKTQMRLGELVSSARMSEYEVYEIVAAAVEAGLTEVLETPEAEVEEPAEATPRVEKTAPKLRASAAKKRPQARSRLLAVAMVIWVLVVCGFGMVRLVQSTIGPPTGVSRQLERREARARLMHGLEIYRALNGNYPLELETLTSAQLVGERLIQRADVATYLPLPNQEKYRLRFTEADADPNNH